MRNLADRTYLACKPGAAAQDSMKEDSKKESPREGAPGGGGGGVGIVVGFWNESPYMLRRGRPLPSSSWDALNPQSLAFTDTQL